MDGNGRWAKKRLLPRAMGHKKGVEAVRQLVRALRDTDVEALTLYAFSTENWGRPADEIADLTALMKHFIRSDLDEIADAGVRLNIIGDYSAFDEEAVALIDGALERTAANTAVTLTIALNYGSQAEIVRAARAAAAEGEVTEEAIARHLDTAGLPPLDLLIRTSGEVRLSNFLLWQAAYAELYFTDVLWPDFSPAHFREALDHFAGRERRYGGR
ncbi:di-trans,poly-cis-decaprenylcistransferase [Croceicoccus ponticola]|uniref:Isoprenyl transferase n=1 Tax=Croceicoccus ponticola TaxID=2217664 RepID=A0A437GW25_9SPHN|nr:polyprenyl diphosphate synthase [Croceicoccus ponticola]RVQ65828.1 di-trans,poly-cis-decaprenylcistransferase [Croceicoccus ponticola]